MNGYKAPTMDSKPQRATAAAADQWKQNAAQTRKEPNRACAGPKTENQGTACADGTREMDRQRQRGQFPRSRRPGAGIHLRADRVIDVKGSSSGALPQKTGPPEAASCHRASPASAGSAGSCWRWTKRSIPRKRRRSGQRIARPLSRMQTLPQRQRRKCSMQQKA